ncbi:MAG: 50S ribosomal protein L6 [Ruminococcaceae bacterium]|nr:50S ribosomal protein L6 [Oscillospiraceae bacterium]
MSRIGRAPITVPAGVTVTIGAGNVVTVKGPKGTLTNTFNTNMTIEQKDGVITVARPNDEKESRAIHGLTRTLINNMVVGVTEGYAKQLEIVGVGYRAEMQGTKINMNLGYSHPVVIEPVDGIKFAVSTNQSGNSVIDITGIDKQVVGQVAAEIRSKRPPEPYKGKGVKYTGERIRRKAGKTGK